MTVTLRWLSTVTMLVLALFGTPTASLEAVDEHKIRSKEVEEEEGKNKLESLGNSSPAANSSGEEWSEHEVDDPELIAAMVDVSIKNSTARRNLGYFSCLTGNPIDDCWRCDTKWQSRRKRLADCAIGFGRNAIDGRDGRYYVVTDPNHDDPITLRPGTLRHAVIQDRPLWILFKRDMVISLKQELMMNSFKTIDARGRNVHIANGGCITIGKCTFNHLPIATL